MTNDWKATIAKLARMTPTLFLRDPLFRYATIAAAIALLFLIAQVAQDLAGPSSIPAAPSASAGGEVGKPQVSAAPPAAPRGSSAASVPEQSPSIAPGRPLNGLAVEPAPADTFGKLPKGAKFP